MKQPEEEDQQEKKQKNRKKNSQSSSSRVIPRRSTQAGTQESCHQTQLPTHSAVDPTSRASKSLDHFGRVFVDGNQKIGRELGLLAPERNSSKPQYPKRRKKAQIDECHQFDNVVTRTAMRSKAGDKKASAALPALTAQHEEAIKRSKNPCREDKRTDTSRRDAYLAKSVLESTNQDETWRYVRTRPHPPNQCVSITPIYHKGELKIESPSVNGAWTDHYTELCADIS